MAKRPSLQSGQGGRIPLPPPPAPPWRPVIGGADVITPKEVASWFPKSVHGQPSAEECANLADSFDLRRLLSAVYQPTPQEQALHDCSAEYFLAARGAGRAFLREIDNIRRSTPQMVLGSTVESAYVAIQNFLNKLQEVPTGGPPSVWLRFATDHAPIVRRVLEDHSIHRRSINPAKHRVISETANTSPVVAVLRQAIARIFKIEMGRAEIGSALRRQAAKAKVKSD
jgi:hypothetical protein